MKDINETNFSESQLDSLIERTLARYAEAARARFAVVPNARLTAKLALSTASRGLLRSLGGKLAIYAAGAIVAGSAIYFFPSIFQQPKTAPAPQVIQRPVQQIAPTPEMTETTGGSAKTLSSKPGLKAGTQAAIRHNPDDRKSQTPKLDEGDDKNIPKIVEKHYEPPLK